jgi:hypothetical protein
MVDEYENPIEIEDGGILTGLTCDRRIRQQKFMATYTVDSCAKIEGRSRSSKSNITVTATTNDGEKLVTTRTLKCNK